MSADLDLIRRAAGRMRELANDALLAGGDEAWVADGITWNDNRGTVYMVGAGPVNVCDAITEEQAEHIAHWDPVTALAVADSLDHDATAWEEYAKRGRGLPFARRERVLAVARAFLKEDADG